MTLNLIQDSDGAKQTDAVFVMPDKDGGVGNGWGWFPGQLHPVSPWVRASQLPELFCSWDLAYRCTQSGWLKPVVQGKRRTIYRLVDVMTCMRRIEAGESPSPRSKSNSH